MSRRGAPGSTTSATGAERYPVMRNGQGREARPAELDLIRERGDIDHLGSRDVDRALAAAGDIDEPGGAVDVRGAS